MDKDIRIAVLNDYLDTKDSLRPAKWGLVAVTGFVALVSTLVLIFGPEYHAFYGLILLVGISALILFVQNLFGIVIENTHNTIICNKMKYIANVESAKDEIKKRIQARLSKDVIHDIKNRMENDPVVPYQGNTERLAREENNVNVAAGIGLANSPKYVMVTSGDTLEITCRFSEPFPFDHYSVGNSYGRNYWEEKEKHPCITDDRNCSTDWRTLFKALCHIPGVKSVTFRGFDITINKAKLYQWSEIQPTIESLLANFLGEPNIASDWQSFLRNFHESVKDNYNKISQPISEHDVVRFLCDVTDGNCTAKVGYAGTVINIHRSPCRCAGWNTSLEYVAVNGHHPECPHRNDPAYPNGSSPDILAYDVEFADKTNNDIITVKATDVVKV